MFMSMKREEKFFCEGQITFDKLDEGEYRQLTFNPPVVVKWSMYGTFDYENPLREYNEYVKTVFVDYDFGLSDKFKPYSSIKCGWAYAGITEQTPIEEIVKAFVEYDLCHAFFHYEGDPNYSHLHWALRGWLENRATIKDKE